MNTGITASITNNVAEVKKAEEEKIVELLLVDEAELEAELEEIKRNAEAMQKISVQNKPNIIFETEEDVPTLSHQAQPVQKPKPETPFKEINESAGANGSSLNERLKQSKKMSSQAV